MDTCTFWFAVETVQEQEVLQASYLGRILLCNITNITDTHNGKAAFDGTNHH